jgi:cytochrome c-type biogenesis protein CcmE
MPKKTVRVLVTVLILGGAFITLLATSMRENVQFYKHVDEVMPVADAWYGKTLKLQGNVVPGSISRSKLDALSYRFDVKHGDSVVTAYYKGVVPDNFADNAEVVVTGQLSQAGFQVEPDGVMAKCPSKYEASTAPNLTPAKGLAQ